MIRLYLLTAGAGLLLLSTGCSSTSNTANNPADIQAVKAQEAAWSTDCGTNDSAKCTAYYSADATVMAPGMAIIHGRDAAKGVFDTLMKDPNFKLSFKGDVAEVSGDLAYTQGTYAMTVSDPKGNKVNDKGKYLTVWKKQSDGSWKAAEDIFNSDMAPGGGS